jgi:hypothetical protein
MSRCTLRRTLLATLALALSAGCSATDQTSLTDESDVSGAADPADSNQLLLDASDAHVLAGSFSDAGHSIDFSVETFGDQRAITVHAGDGSLLYRAALTADSEQLLLGEHLSLQGPRGSLFVKGEPSFDAVHVSGDLSTAHSVLSRPEFQLTQRLGQALAERTDIDPALFPGELPLGAPSAGALQDDAPERVQQKNHDPTGCAVCHAACSASVLACVAVTWGPLAFLCVPPGIACHIGCAGSACQ